MNVSSVKNLNGETFSAVQDTFLTNIVSSNSANWNEISAYQANSGNFLTAVPAGTMNESAFEYDANDKISGYNGSAFAGGSVPAGTMNESGLEYDASGNISAYSGSAFAAQLPEEEEVEFEELNISGISAATDYITATSGDINATIDNVSANSGAWGGSALPISAGPGIKFEMADGTLVASTDETVIFNGNISGQLTNFTATEPITNFKELNVYVAVNDDGSTILEGKAITYDVSALSAQNALSIGGSYTISNGYTCFYNLFYQITNSTVFAKTVNKRFWIQPQSALPLASQVSYNPTSTVEQLKNGYIYKIVGVDRIGGN